MDGYSSKEKRKYPRLKASFIISYRVKIVPDNYDLTQTKNISQGGLLLTTNREFQRGTILSISIRFPFVSRRIEFEGEVVDSKKVVTNLIYETRIRFREMNVDFFKKLGDYVSERLKNGY